MPFATFFQKMQAHLLCNKSFTDNNVLTDWSIILSRPSGQSFLLSLSRLTVGEGPGQAAGNLYTGLDYKERLSWS
jgi:hypothetical protein